MFKYLEAQVLCSSLTLLAMMFLLVLQGQYMAVSVFILMVIIPGQL